MITLDENDCWSLVERVPEPRDLFAGIDGWIDGPKRRGKGRGFYARVNATQPGPRRLHRSWHGPFPSAAEATAAVETWLAEARAFLEGA
jgi:hypothetical protein